MVLIRWLLGVLGYRLVRCKPDEPRTVYVPVGAVIHSRPE